LAVLFPSLRETRSLCFIRVVAGKEEIVGGRVNKRAVKLRKRELKKARRRRRRRRFLLLSLLVAAAMVVSSYMRRPSPGSGKVTFEDENPGGLAFMVGQLLMAFLKDPSKKAIADKMNVAIAIQDMFNPELAATLIFRGSDVTIKNGVSAETQVYLGLEMDLLLKMAGMGRGVEMLKFFQTEEGKAIIAAFREGRIQLRGVMTHPVQMMQFGLLMSPPRQAA